MVVEGRPSHRAPALDAGRARLPGSDQEHGGAVAYFDSKVFCHRVAPVVHCEILGAAATISTKNLKSSLYSLCVPVNHPSESLNLAEGQRIASGIPVNPVNFG